MPPKRLPPSLQQKLYSDRAPILNCPYCPRIFRNLSGLSQHRNSAHPASGAENGIRRRLHSPSPSQSVSGAPNHAIDMFEDGCDMLPFDQTSHPPPSPQTPFDDGSKPRSSLFRDIHPTLDGKEHSLHSEICLY